MELRVKPAKKGNKIRSWHTVQTGYPISVISLVYCPWNCLALIPSVPNSEIKLLKVPFS